METKCPHEGCNWSITSGDSEFRKSRLKLHEQRKHGSGKSVSPNRSSWPMRVP